VTREDARKFQSSFGWKHLSPRSREVEKVVSCQICPNVEIRVKGVLLLEKNSWGKEMEVKDRNRCGRRGDCKVAIFKKNSRSNILRRKSQKKGSGSESLVFQLRQREYPFDVRGALIVYTEG